MGSRRSRRAHGRLQTKTPHKSSGISKARKQAARQQQKAAILSAARTARENKRQQSPHLLAILALNPTEDSRLSALTDALSNAAALEASRHCSFDKIIVSRAGSERDTLLAALDAAKVADSFLLVFDGRADMDDTALSLLDALRAQGLPTVQTVAIGDGADDADLRKLRGRQLAAESLGEDHVLRPLPGRLGMEDDTKVINRALIRRVFAKAPRPVAWRQRYGYMRVMASEMASQKAGTSEEDSHDPKVALALRGWVRGRGFSPNELVHLTGFGSFSVAEIVDATNGRVLGKREEGKGEPVESEAEPDETMGEQTWPPEVDDEDGVDDEDEQDDEENDIGQLLAQAYDAAADRDNCADEDNGEGNEDDSDGEDMEDDGEWAGLLGLNESGRNKSGIAKTDGKSGTASVSFSAIGTEDIDDMTVDEDEVAKIRAAARTDSEFPDEVDTPINQPARMRFARYRGLKSLRTGDWDPKELLPREYATLFQFRNIAATRKRVLAVARREAEAALEAARPNHEEKQMKDDNENPNFVVAGREVILRLENVPTSIATKVQTLLESDTRPVVASGMLRHENRRSVVHFAVRRVDNNGEHDGAEIIKAKTPMEMHVGFVRFDGRPMFSEHNANSDKHKMERFLRHGRLTVASFYGPSVYAPAPALLCWQGGKVVAAGGALGADPDRIILKRIILTGYPFKTQKRRCVVRFMFFSPEDIRWFKPVELWTKLGRSGHIMEPLGTHGHMKCLFDNVVLHHDTVCMTLYKRVYPKLLSPTHRAGDDATRDTPTLTS